MFLARLSDATESILPSSTVDVSRFLSGQGEELALVALMEVWYTSLLVCQDLSEIDLIRLLVAVGNHNTQRRFRIYAEAGLLDHEARFES